MTREQWLAEMERAYREDDTLMCGEHLIAHMREWSAAHEPSNDTERAYQWLGWPIEDARKVEAFISRFYPFLAEKQENQK